MHPESSHSQFVAEQVHPQFKQLTKSINDGTSQRYSMADAWLPNIPTELLEGMAPHPDGEAADAEARVFADRYGLWVSGYSEHILNMAQVLHRSAESKARLVVANKVYLISYFIDDILGNERQAKATSEQRAIGKALFQAIDKILAERGVRQPKYDHANRQPNQFDAMFEEVIFDLTQNLQTLAPKHWLDEFFAEVNQHFINATTSRRDDSLTELGYGTHRYYDSGMNFTLQLNQYCSNQYLDKALIKTIDQQHQTDLVASLTNLDFRSAALAAYMNDVFSFHKEAIVFGTDVNYLVVLMRQRSLSLEKAIEVGLQEMAQWIKTFFPAVAKVRQELAKVWQNYQQQPDTGAYLEQILAIDRHLSDLEDNVLAAWFWQAEMTDRYIVPKAESLFKETHR